MKMRPMLRKIFFITIPAILIFLIALELCLRTFGYLCIQRHNSDSNAKIAQFSKDEFRILCLGDSFTVGMGTAPENSYPRQLEKILQKNISKKISVINEGRFANTSSLLLKNLQEDINKYFPSIIIIMIGCNNSWNFEDSSYFLLYNSYVSFPKRLERLLSSFRIYKLLRIGWINFKHKTDGNEKMASDNNPICKIKPESLELSASGDELLRKGECVQAIEKVQEALKIDSNNYYAHLSLAGMRNSQKEFQLAEKEIWQAVNLIDEWDDHLICTVLLAINRLGDKKEAELVKLKSYFKSKYYGDKRSRPLKIIEADLDFSKNETISKVLEYDLERIVRLARENRVTLILQTYPKSILENVTIETTSRKYNSCLVNNEIIFKEKAQSDFFVADGHCNDKGYGLIAENVYDILVKKEILSRKIIGEENNGR